MPSSETSVTTGLNRIERAFFYTHKNILILYLLGAVSSLLLASSVVSPSSLYAIPFYCYSAASIIISVMLIKHHIEPDTTISIKVLIDALLTVYWVDVHVLLSGTTSLYFLPIVILLTSVLYNLTFDKHRILLICIYLLVIGNGAVFILLTKEEMVHQISEAVYFMIVSLTIWAHIAYVHYKKNLHKDIASKESRIDALVNSSKTNTLATRIVHHEITNELTRLSHCIYRLKSQKDKDFSREIALLKQCNKNIPEHVRTLSETHPAQVSLLAMLNVVLQNEHCCVNFSEDALVQIPLRLLVSFVSNIYENSLQAYERKHGNCDNFKFNVYLDENSLCLEDNAGGFDTSAIELGKSSKGEGHGLFLATLLNDTSHLGLTTSLEQIENGTRVKLTFDTLEK